MAQAITSRRQRCRPDRAQRHGELADLAQIRGVWTLRDVVVDCGGEESWRELVERIDTARHTVPGTKRIGSQVGVDACLDGLTVLASLHRTQEIGFRGLIGASEEISARCAEVLGRERGCSDRTMREVWRVLEHAELLERWTHGRGKVIEYGAEHPAAMEPAEEPKRARRKVLGLTLSLVAISYWSAPRRRRGGGTCGRVGEKPTSANPADNTIGGKRGLTTPGNARATISSAPSSLEASSEVSPCGDAVAHGADAPRTTREGSARTVPDRLVGWRPDPHAPNDYGTATRAMLYDLETVCLHHRRPDRDRIIGLVRHELHPLRRIEGIVGGCDAPNSGLPWDSWIWRWRGMPLEDRRVACERAILPAILGRLRRLDLCELEPDPNASPPRSRAHREVGPRVIPQRNTAPPETVIVGGRPPPWMTQPRVPPPRARGDDPVGVPGWLRDARRRYCGEEDT